MPKRYIILIIAVCMLSFALAGTVSAQSAGNTEKITLRFLGHAAFLLTKGETNLLFDPYLSKNPARAIMSEEITKCDYILVSHAHADHLGDTVSIAARTGAAVVTTAEVARLVAAEGVKTHPMHIGGKKAFDFGYVRVTTAVHGSGVAGGHAAGFIVKFYGTTLYFAGDTGLFGDMALLGRLEKIDYALLPIGDNYTMGPDDAAEAVSMLKPTAVVPMHYNTHALIMQSPEDFKRTVENRFNVPVHIMKPGQTIVLN